MKKEILFGFFWKILKRKRNFLSSTDRLFTKQTVENNSHSNVGRQNYCNAIAAQKRILFGIGGLEAQPSARLECQKCLIRKKVFLHKTSRPYIVAIETTCSARVVGGGGIKKQPIYRDFLLFYS